MRLGEGGMGRVRENEDGEIGTSVGDVPDVCLQRLQVRPHTIVLKGL